MSIHAGILSKITKDVIDRLHVILPIISSNMDRIVSIIINHLPLCERMLFDAFELLFAPRHIMRQLLLSAAVSGLIMGGKMLGNVGNAIVVFLSKAEREQKDVMNQLNKARRYAEWRLLAERLDFMRGVDKWRMNDKSSLYDFQVLKKRINDTIEMIQQGDVFRLMFRMRGTPLDTSLLYQTTNKPLLYHTTNKPLLYYTLNTLVLCHPHKVITPPF